MGLGDYSQYLQREMLLHAKDALAKDGKFKVLIKDGDTDMQNICAKHGFVPTNEREFNAVYTIADVEKIGFVLPEGFKITSMAENYDLFRYGQVLWHGFDHEDNDESIFESEDIITYDYKRVSKDQM